MFNNRALIVINQLQITVQCYTQRSRGNISVTTGTVHLSLLGTELGPKDNNWYYYNDNSLHEFTLLLPWKIYLTEWRFIG